MAVRALSLARAGHNLMGCLLLFGSIPSSVPDDPRLGYDRSYSLASTDSSNDIDWVPTSWVPTSSVAACVV